VYQRFIDWAVCQLVENAIEQTPHGGEVNITLVESDNRWELEVADSAPQPSPANDSISGRNRNVNRMSEIREAVDLHGGTICSFKCPQGGTANSILIPIQSNTHPTA
jgi:K+-sensing histidine kinase KdpD